MKRGAERQITKGEDDPEDIEEISGDGTFSKADDATLATRKIKGMPRRLAGSPSAFPTSSSDSAAANSASESPATPPPPKFSSFGGFGSSTSSSNPFSFTPPAAAPSFPPSKPTSNIFSSNTSPTPSRLFSAATPAVGPTASNAAKTLASFLGDSSSKPAATSAPSPPTQSNASGATSEGDALDGAVLKYYTSLRGLNMSILDAITKAIDKDPFTDVASLMVQYNSHRIDLQKQFDQRPKSATSTSALSSAPSPSPFGTPTPMPSTPAAAAKMPAPPPVFTGFGQPAAVAAPPPKTNGSADAPPAVPSKPFSFGSPSSSTSTSTSTAPKASIFAPSATSPFASSSSSSTPSAFGSVPAASLFGSTTASPFGATQSPSPFGPPKPATGLFGSGGGSFGSSASQFGGGGSIGNPVGFGFGSPKGAGSSQEASKETTGGATAEEESSGSQESVADNDKPSTDEVTPAGTSSTLFGDETFTGMDAEGEGEEDEETVQSARVKAYIMRKQETGGDGGWLDIGLGILRLKKHKETSARRLLLRNSHSGKIQIQIQNFALYPKMKASLVKKSLTFVGHEDGQPQTYTIRFRSPEMAKDFNEALEKEVVQV